jgi:hypothetical protein
MRIRSQGDILNVHDTAERLFGEPTGFTKAAFATGAGR